MIPELNTSTLGEERDTCLICDTEPLCLCTTSTDDGDCDCMAADAGAMSTTCVECGAEMHRIDFASGEKLAWTVAT